MTSRERVPRMLEALELIKRLWTEEVVTFEGKHFRVHDATCTIRPVQKPYPPIYVGGGRRAFERIARFGDAWLANGLPPGKLEPMLKELREVAGSDVPVSVFNASSDPEDLEAYAQLGVERVLLGLPTLPESETLRQLDNLARVATDTR
jgi:alkanesulfonate monooxygenase SsuD/methylene tetrahydromethanopterin reductase-like flavin-dependent oxidoreductase (luciferase family)